MSTDEDWKIRTCTEADVPQVRQVWVEGLGQTYEHLEEGEERQQYAAYFEIEAQRATGPDGDLADPLAYWLRGDKGTFLVAIDSAGRVGGCAGVKAGEGMEWDSDVEECKTASVWRMSVAAYARRKGLGRKLMQAVEEWATAHGYARVQMVTANPQASAFYEALGFSVFKRGGPVKFHSKDISRQGAAEMH